jgi:phosphate transport system substrate-binding protein
MKKILIALAIMIPFLFSVMPVHAGQTEILGAGATFPYPLYSKMFDAYYKEFDVKVNYQSIGSGGGQLQLLSKTVDFGGSDAFMTNEQLKDAPGAILHIPTCLGSVVITYNLAGNPELKLTPDVLADIFLGKITKWNDARIMKINPGVELPGGAIMVVHRSDGSGTTNIFTDYLTKVSKSWADNVGVGKSVNWPVGLGGKGNEGVAGLIKQTPASIGYVELIYAEENGMSYAELQNKSGKFVKPSLTNTAAAANTALPADTRVSITNTASPDGYPIAGFTWILLYKEQNYNKRTLEQGKAVAKLIWWMTHEGQRYATPLKYAPLPKEAITKAEALLKSITYGNKSIL